MQHDNMVNILLGPLTLLACSFCSRFESFPQTVQVAVTFTGAQPSRHRCKDRNSNRPLAGGATECSSWWFNLQPLILNEQNTTQHSCDNILTVFHSRKNTCHIISPIFKVNPFAPSTRLSFSHIFLGFCLRKETPWVFPVKSRTSWMKNDAWKFPSHWQLTMSKNNQPRTNNNVLLLMFFILLYVICINFHTKV